MFEGHKVELTVRGVLRDTSGIKTEGLTREEVRALAKDAKKQAEAEGNQGSHVKSTSRPIRSDS